MGNMTLADQIRHRFQGDEIIYRTVHFREAEGGTDGGSNEISVGEEKYRGMAVPFNSVTRVYDWIDGEFDEQFVRTAFDEFLSRETPVLLFEHGRHMSVGRIPIGRFEGITPTKRGLEFVADPFRNWLTEPIRDAVQAGVLAKMSVGFRAKDMEVEEREDDVPLVTHTRSELPEMSVVLWPAYRDTELELKSKQAEGDPTRLLASAEPARGGRAKGRRNSLAEARYRLLRIE